MNFLLSALFCSQAVLADYDGAVSAVNAAAGELSSSVASFSSADGLAAALGIQNDFPTLSSAVGSLSSVAVDASDSTIDVSATTSLASSIAGLLDALTSKAGDFNSIGVKNIVEGDISSLQGPAVGIVSGIVHAVSGDSAKIGSLTDALNSIESAFASADSAYGIATSSWPAVEY